MDHIYILNWKKKQVNQQDLKDAAVLPWPKQMTE